MRLTFRGKDSRGVRFWHAFWRKSDRGIKRVDFRIISHTVSSLQRGVRMGL